MPVVVIGNVYVGGTGKTPMVIATVEGLRARGFNPGVVSRGYGAKIGPEPRVGHGAALAASAFGDEPALIARASARRSRCIPSARWLPRRCCARIPTWT